MAYRLSIRRSAARAIAWLAAALFLASMPILAGAAAPVQAQVAVKADFRTALEPHGTWRNSSRWGEVWVPSNRPHDWQPYTVGHWVFTDDWGWYWIEDQSEAVWGVVTYHYGRWVLEDDVWIWMPGEEWGPGWVNWRGSNRPAASGRSGSRTAVASYVGWSAMPPDEVVEEYWEEPRVWAFVRTRDFTAPVVARVVLPLSEREVAIRETVVINRTVVIREQGFAVNPGIPPVLIAAEIRRPLRSYDVRPVVLAGTARIPGAVELRAEELRTAQSERIRVTARETRNEIRPSGRLPQIQPLRPGEQGRYFDNPPRAVQRVQQGQPQQPTTGQGPSGRDQQQGQGPGDRQRQQQQGQTPGQQLQQQGRDAGRGKQQQQGQQPGQPQGTQGRGSEDQRQQQGKEQGKAKDLGKQQQGKAKDLGNEQGKGDAQQPGQPQGTQGRGTDEQRQQGREGAKQQQKGQRGKEQQNGQQGGAGQQGTEGRGTDQQRQQRRDLRGEGAKEQQPGVREEQRQPQGTQGRGGEDQRPQQRGEGARQKQQDLGREGRGAAEPKGGSEGTQGRGGASEQQRQPQQGRGKQQPMPQGGTEGRGGGGEPKSENRAAPPQQQRPSATQGRGGGLEQREGR
jgi:uncharacterized protein DUF6600